MDRASFDRRLAKLLAGSPHNLVSGRDRAKVLQRHVAESRRLAAHLAGLHGRWMDLGTGGGLPGLVLAHQHPQAQWVLLDSSAKKAAEVERFAEQLGVRCRVRVGRAEEVAREDGWRGAFDGVVARAVAPLRVLVELARGFLRDGGRLVAVKGPGAEQEVVAAQDAMARAGVQAEAIVALDERTRIVTLVARGAVPEAVPRRTGVPQRRPW